MYLPKDIVNHVLIPFVDEYQEATEQVLHSLRIFFEGDIPVKLAMLVYPANTGPEAYMFRFSGYKRNTSEMMDELLQTILDVNFQL